MATVGEDLFDANGRVIRPILGEDSSGNKYILITNSSGQLEVVLVSNTDGTYIGDIKFGEALPAGTALIGKVGIDQATANANEVVVKTGTSRIGTVSGVLKEVRTTKAIDASIGAYAVNDVVNDTDCCTTATAWTFASVGRAVGAYGKIVGARIVSQTPSITPSLTLLLFNATPTVGGATVLEDNTANNSPTHADKLKYIDKIDFYALESLGTTTSCAFAIPLNLPLPFKCAAADTNLYGILVTRSIFTQVATNELEITLEVEQY